MGSPTPFSGLVLSLWVLPGKAVPAELFKQAVVGVRATQGVGDHLSGDRCQQHPIAVMPAGQP